MPRIVQTTVYRLTELPETAKRRARDWYRETCFDHDWYDAVYDDFETVCQILGVTPPDQPRQADGRRHARTEPHLLLRLRQPGRWSLLRGRIQPCKGRPLAPSAPMRRRTRRCTPSPTPCKRRRSPTSINSTPRSGSAVVTRHEWSMAIEVERDSPTGQPVTYGAEDAVIEALRDLARWLYRRLEGEYDHLMSDAVVDESIAANGMTFTGTGQRFG